MSNYTIPSPEELERNAAPSEEVTSVEHRDTNAEIGESLDPPLVQANLLNNASAAKNFSNPKDHPQCIQLPSPAERKQDLVHSLRPYEAPPMTVVQRSAVGTATSQATNIVDVAVSRAAKKFVDLPDALRRSLVPIVKVYKTFINEDEKQVDLRLRTDPDNNGVNRVDLERIDFIRKGGNPAEVDTNIEFNITLSARELGFYFVKQYPKSEQGGDDAFTLEKESNGVAWIDLIKIDPGRDINTSVNNSELVINETDARMKVLLGYATPVRKPAGMLEATWTEWKNIITSQQEVFYLNLFKHQFDFKPSGEVGLSIDFIASGNGRTLVPEADIMLGPRYTRRLAMIKKELKDKKAILRGIPHVEDVEREEGEISYDFYNDCIRRVTSAAEVTIEGFERQIAYLKALSRRRLLNQLEMEMGLGSKSRIKMVLHINTEEQSYETYRHNAWGAEDADGLYSQNEHRNVYILFGEIIEAALEILAHNGLLGEAGNKEDFSAGNDSAYLRQWTSNDMESGKLRKYLYPFGALDAFESRRLRTIKKYGGIVLGNITYDKPQGGRHTCSLADLPISYDLFKAWWENKTSSKTVYFYRDFLASLIGDFLPSTVFGGEVYGVESEAVDYEKPKFSMLTVAVPNAIVTEFVTRRWQHNRQPIDTSVFSNKIDEADSPPVIDPNAPPRMPPSSSDADLSSLLLIQQVRDSNARVSPYAPRLLWGQSTRGILESVSFQREDIPGYGEARIMSDRTAVANNMMLNEKYNTSLELIGNTVFLPGCQLYLDPRPLDLGFADERGSYARSLGMGGLYIVNYVEHQMDFIEKSWKTTLDTKWESFGDGSGGDNNEPTLEEMCQAEGREGRQQQIDDIQARDKARLAMYQNMGNPANVERMQNEAAQSRAEQEAAGTWEDPVIESLDDFEGLDDIDLGLPTPDWGLPTE